MINHVAGAGFRLLFRVLTSPEARLIHELHGIVMHWSPEAQLVHEMRCILVLTSPDTQASS
jgi:hypothetical protein